VTTTHFLSLIVIGLATLAGPAALSTHAAHPAVVRASSPPSGSSDVWLVETRGLPNPCAQHGVSERIHFQRLDQGCFVSATKEEFLASLIPDQTTCFFVHGNRVSASDARSTGLSLRRHLDSGQTPFRYVIWSWPSERISGMIRDARAKASRADGESYYLGSVLAEMPAEANTSLIGYSFGARAITGSLHLLGGGIVRGNSLGISAKPTIRPRAVLMAAALPRAWLLPGGANSLAPFQVEQMLLFYNRNDPALRHFPLVFHPGRPEALGFEGIAAWQLGQNGSLLRQLDVGRTVGRSHSLSKYTDSAGIMATVRAAVLDAPAL
jgi:hypothetical protein